MAPVTCGKCKLEVIFEETGYECDGCNVFYHMKCGGAIKKDITSRIGSKRLQIYCEICKEKDPIHMVADNVKSILKYIYKIDLALQKQVETNATFEHSITKNTSKIEQMFLQLCDLPKEITPALQKVLDERVNDGGTNTYASVSNRGGVRPTVLIKPKDNTQKSGDTLVEMKSIGNDVLVRDVRNVNGGGIVLTCDTANDTMKVKQLVQQQTNDKYIVELPAIKKPRIKIANVCESFTSDELVNEVKLKNEAVQNGQFDVKKIHTKKRDGNNQSFDVIAEVDSVTFDALMKMKKVCIGWRSYYVTEHLYLKRCFKCCGFSHIAKDCKHQIACSRCAGSHKATDCNGTVLACVNCKCANELNGLNLDTTHHAWSKNCVILNKRLNKLKDSIQYGIVEIDK